MDKMLPIRDIDIPVSSRLRSNLIAGGKAMKRTQTGLLAALEIGLAVAAQSNPEAGKQLEAAIHKEVADGDLKGAIEQFRKVASRYRTDRKIAASAMLHIGQCQEKLGQAEARKAYESVIKEFADQPEIATQARSRLAG